MRLDEKIVTVLVISALIGCDGPPITADAGLDAGPTDDAALDASPDATALSDAAPDAAPRDDASADAGRDGGADGGAPSSALVLDVDTYTFPAIDVGETIAQSFVVSNEGDGASGALSVELAQAGAAFAIELDDCTGLSLAGGTGSGLGACTIRVAFRPLETGPARAVLSVVEEGGASLTASLGGEATGPARYRLEPAAHDFGTIGMGTGGAAATLTLRNAGTRLGSLPIASLTGADADQFHVGGFTCTSGLAGGASCTYTVTYNPTRSGRASATLEVDAATGGHASALLEAAATDPAMLVVSPLGPVSFGTTEVGAQSAAASFTVENRGGTVTGGLAVSLLGTHASQFAIVTDSCNGAALHPGDACATTVDFRPLGVAGSRVAVLEITGAPVVTLHGNAVARRGLVASPHGHGFGTVPIGASATQTLTITNPSALPAGPITTAITGDGAASFSITGTTCATLAPGASCTIDVRFTSSGAPGDSVATLALSAPGLPPLLLGLAGSRAAPAALIFSQSSHAYGTLLVRDLRSATFTLRNGGAVATSTITTELFGVGFVSLADDCDGATLAPGATCAVEVGFSPADGGDTSGTLTASASVGGTASVHLTGTGDADFPLTVTMSGDGSGRVTAAPSLVCPGDCVQEYLDGTSVTLTVTPDPGSELVGFSGDCTGTSCTVTMDRPRTVGVELRRVRLALEVDAVGIDGAGGRIVALRPGIDCDSSCTGSFCGCSASLPFGTRVVLQAVPDGARTGFRGWTGACAGSGRTCEITMDAAKSVTGTFVPYNVVFATSEVFVPGSLGGVATADAHCQRLADAAGLPGTFRAWLSTSSEGAVEHVGLGSPSEPRGFVRPDGRPFADSLAQLSAGQVLYPPVLDETGASIGIPRDVFTGTGRDGRLATDRACDDWTSTSGMVVAGLPGGEAVWTIAESPSCDAPRPMYCFGTSYHAPLHYERATGRTAFVSSAAFDPTSGVESADALCNAEAAAAGLDGTYRAYLETSHVAAEDRFDTTGAPWVRTDGVSWLASAADLGSGTPVSALNVTADGRHVSPAWVWTGDVVSSGFLGVLPFTCDDWTSASFQGAWAHAGRLDRAFFHAVDLCFTPFSFVVMRVYCLEE